VSPAPIPFPIPTYEPAPTAFAIANSIEHATMEDVLAKALGALAPQTAEARLSAGVIFTPPPISTRRSWREKFSPGAPSSVGPKPTWRGRLA
jgi:hypothetical protein